MKKVNYDQTNLPKADAQGNTFGICHIFAAKNDTFIHVTDITGAETIARVSGGQMVKRHQDEPSPYAAMQATQKLVEVLRARQISSLHIRIRANGGVGRRNYGQGGSSTIRTLVRNNFKIGRIEDVTPIPSDRTRHKGGRRGRRL
ncbi:Ribosomal protein S14 [Spironucleus salmonicida]|uniref:Small ribosomal subunit protein uS11 n=2 Tax=Spironucleus salmonicida TaxID=348837 RepID=V6LTE5_9EUKA|nr:Ribosomal protein S11 [Spironucleus salmonicida]KAH0570986.1 Ribosomal protein S11 [Spironucleus salmonicida]KAH0570988.1 Ribosomal protein S14 [Spironucleus salmonicida]|eukprot:EST44292.1 Ribosomal protein S14 [Spironucleus salmonicida]